MSKGKSKYGQGRVYQPKYTDKKTGEIRTVDKFWIQWSDGNGGQHREATWAKTETQARQILIGKQGGVQRGNVPLATGKSLRYGDIREAFLRKQRIDKTKSLEHLSDGTETMKGLTKLDEFFGYKAGVNEGLKVSAITSKAWEDDFIMARRLEGASDATIKNSATHLRQMLKLALEQNRIASIPRIYVPPSPPARKIYLDKEQFEATRSAMPPKFHPALTFLFFQGVRITETLGVLWSDIDLVRASFIPYYDRNKTGDDVGKPLAMETVKALRSLKRTDDGPVFEGITAKMFEKAFRKAMLRLGYGRPMWQCSQCRSTDKLAPAPKHKSDPAIVCKNCQSRGRAVPMKYHYVGPTPHCVRASTVVYYREGAVPDAMIMEITGHKSSRSFDGYSRVRTQALKEKMDVNEASRNRLREEDAAAYSLSEWSKQQP
jgi:integrase